MSKPPLYARIAITLPAGDLSAADRLAAEQDRSRSWIVAEAVRRYVASQSDASSVPASGVVYPAPSAMPTVALVAEPGLGSSRLAQLTRDMAMTPEARVRAAEETLRVAELRAPRRGHTLVGFDRYEDFLDWKKARAVGA